MLVIHRITVRYLYSIESKIFLTSVILHISIQLILNILLPVANYSRFSGHDGSVYYTMSLDPFPNNNLFTFKRYQRPLLPLLIYTFFSWNRYVGFILINIIAVSIALVYFYKIIEEDNMSYALPLTLLFAITPYLFSGTHLGLTEPLMIAGLLAGYYYARKKDRWKSVCCYAIALMAKEISIFPILAELVLQIKSYGFRSALYLVAIWFPIAIWYLLLGLLWNEPLWMVHGPGDDLGFGLRSIIDLMVNSPIIEGGSRNFIVLNQVANGLMLMLIIIGLYQLRQKLSILLWGAFSAIPLLFLGQSVYLNNFDLGRQALPCSLLFIALCRYQLMFNRKFYWLGAGILLCISLFWILYFAKFFIYY